MVGGNIYIEFGVYVDVVFVFNFCNDIIVIIMLIGIICYLLVLEYIFCVGDSLVLDNQVFMISISFVDILVGFMLDCFCFQFYEIVV